MIPAVTESFAEHRDSCEICLRALDIFELPSMCTEGKKRWNATYPEHSPI